MYQQLTMFDIVNGQEKQVRRITYQEAKPFIESIHYSRKMPQVTDAFGLFVDGEMVGVVTYGMPASRPLCKGLAGIENAPMVRELNRLAILPKFSGGGGIISQVILSEGL